MNFSKKILNSLFKGRVGRNMYFWSIIGLGLSCYILFLTYSSSTKNTSLPWLILLLFFGLLSTSVTLKRLHDIGTSGLWLIVYFLGIFLLNFPLSLVPFAILIFIPGSPNKNKFGKNPGLFIN